MKRHVLLCMNCLKVIPLGGACGCDRPAPVYMSEAAAKRKQGKGPSTRRAW